MPETSSVGVTPEGAATTPKGFSFGVAMSFTINYVIGSGFLTLPWAFRKTGVTLGIIVVCASTFFALCSVLFLLETMARAERLCAITEKYWEGTSLQSTKKRRTNSFSSYLVLSQSDENFEKVTDGGSSTKKVNGNGCDEALNDVGPMQVADHKFELPELCEEFLGINGARAYIIIIVLYMVGTLWAYATVFANSISGIIDDIPFAYEIFLGVFACLVVPVSLMELSEQVGIQVAMTIWRIVMLTMMIGTVLLSFCTKTQAFSDYVFDENEPSSLELFRPQNLSYLLPIACYANIFHHSLPALSEPVANKASLAKIFGVTLLLCAVGYIGVGTCVSWYFGSHTMQSSNLNWTTYVGSMAYTHAGKDKSFTAMVVSRFVVLFPAFDVASAFPLNAITLGNNLMASYYGHNEIHNIEGSRIDRIKFRLLAVIPPIFGALIVRQVGEITDYTGITGYGITFVIPPMLAYYSRDLLISFNEPTVTKYSCFLTNVPMYIITASVGCFLILYVLVGLISHQIYGDDT
jgi:amino acid permease